MKKNVIPTKQQLAAADPKQSVWVTANAGSGKTHVLVERIIRLLLDGAEPSTLLCITFTKAAAAEMSSRLYERLSRWTAIDDADLKIELSNLGISSPEPAIFLRARQLFTYVLETPGGLKIQTIHAFCERLLQLFPVEAGMAPGFRVLDDRQSRQMREDAKNTVLREVKEGQDKSLKDAFEIAVANGGSEIFDNLIQSFLSSSQNIRSLLDTDIGGEEFLLLLKNSLQIDLNETSQSVGDKIEQLDADAYETHANILARYDLFRNHNAADLMRLAARATDKVQLLKQLYFTKDKALTPRKTLMSVAAAKAHPETQEFIANEKTRILACFNRQDILKRIEATAAIFTLAKAIYTKIENLKRFSGSYDFDDLIKRTKQLLLNAQAAQWVLYKLDSGLNHILLDEAQDTSPAQWQIIQALADEFFSGHGKQQKRDRTIFVVGDRKQSIYSFQGADAVIFAAAKEQFTSFVDGKNASPAKIELTISYRSAAEIINAVNLVFPASVPQRLGFDLKDMSEQDHTTNRIGGVGHVEVWPLIVPDQDTKEQEPWMAPLDLEASGSPKRKLARLIANTIKNWIGNRRLESQNRLVEPGDIMLLLQSRGPLFSMLIAELRKIGVPVAGADRLKLRESIAIQDLLALAQWLLLPEDDYSLACVLKSPFVPKPVNEEELFELSYARGAQSIWGKLQHKQDRNVAWLQELQKSHASATTHELFAKVLMKFRKPMSGRLGPEAGDATDAFLDLALAHEVEHGSSLAGFLHWFNAGETEIKREMEKTSGEVRLMTVHGAKGLEANIVFLPDAASLPKGRSGNQLLIIPNGPLGTGLPLWMLSNLSVAPELQTSLDEAKRKSLAERNRLLYVAMTRARDELYICGAKGKLKDVPKDCWYAMVEPILGVTLIPTPTQIAQAKADILSPNSKPNIPIWAETEAKTEKPIYYASVTKTSSSHHANPTPSDFQRGIAIHYILQELADMPPEQQEGFATTKAKSLNLEESDAAALVRLINQPNLEPFFGPHSQTEVEISGSLENGEFVIGRIDRLAKTEKEVFLLDYKTDRYVPKSINPDHSYVQQISLYAELLKAAYPDHKIKPALLWTQTSKLEWISDELLTQARELAFKTRDHQAS